MCGKPLFRGTCLLQTEVVKRQQRLIGCGRSDGGVQPPALDQQETRAQQRPICGQVLTSWAKYHTPQAGNGQSSSKEPTMSSLSELRNNLCSMPQKLGCSALCSNRKSTTVPLPDYRHHLLHSGVIGSLGNRGILISGTLR